MRSFKWQGAREINRGNLVGSPRKLSSFLILMLHLIVPHVCQRPVKLKTLLNSQLSTCYWQFYHHNLRASDQFQVKRLRFIPWSNKFRVCERTCDEINRNSCIKQLLRTRITHKSQNWAITNWQQSTVHGSTRWQTTWSSVRTVFLVVEVVMCGCHKWLLCSGSQWLSKALDVRRTPPIAHFTALRVPSLVPEHTVRFLSVF